MFGFIISLIIGVVLGAVCGFLFACVKQENNTELSQRYELQESKLNEMSSDRDELTQKFEESRSALASEREKTAQLSGQISATNEQLAFVQHQLEIAQKAEKERIEREHLAAQEREEKKRIEQQESLNEESRVLKALSPVQKNLDLLQQKVADIEEARQKQMGQLSEQLLGLGNAQERLDKETSSLAMALQSNKKRGAWGEAQLKNIVESAGLREHVDFETQYYAQNSDGQKQRPDMVVMLPDGKFIPIDAKVPYSDYQRACAISDVVTEQELRIRDEYLRSHAKALRAHIDELSKREYWKINSDRVAPDFVIAFIPNESLLQAALDIDPTILDYAFNKQVALTSPVTLWSVLKSVAFAWQQQTLSDEAQRLFDLSREMFQRLNKMSEHAVKLGKNLGSSVQSYNAFVGSLQSQVIPTARKLSALEQGKIFQEPTPIEDEKKSDIRAITAPELLPDSGNTFEDDDESAR